MKADNILHDLLVDSRAMLAAIKANFKGYVGDEGDPLSPAKTKDIMIGRLNDSVAKASNYFKDKSNAR